MKNEEFTPGPWKLEFSKHYKAWKVIAESNGEWICEIMPKADTIHNANLIAAAPDMYEALKDFDTMYREILPLRILSVEEKRRFEKVKAALSKANPKSV